MWKNVYLLYQNESVCTWISIYFLIKSLPVYDTIYVIHRNKINFTVIVIVTIIVKKSKISSQEYTYTIQHAKL